MKKMYHENLIKMVRLLAKSGSYRKENCDHHGRNRSGRQQLVRIQLKQLNYNA